jgi:hypothetical protein
MTDEVVDEVHRLICWRLAGTISGVTQPRAKVFRPMLWTSVNPPPEGGGRFSEYIVCTRSRQQAWSGALSR